MAKIITCTECNRDYSVEKLKPGTRIKCRGCSMYLTVPGGRSIACVACGAMFDARSMKPGIRFRCSKCGSIMDVDNTGMPRPVRGSQPDKRTEMLEEVRETNEETTTSETVEEVVEHGSKIRAQKVAPAPAPSSRRFADSEYVPALEDVFRQRKIIAAFIFSRDAMLLAAQCPTEFDAEMISNSFYYLHKVAKYFGDSFSIGGNGTLELSMAKGNLRLHSFGDEVLLVLSSGLYNGVDDLIIYNKLAQKKDLS